MCHTEPVAVIAMTIGFIALAALMLIIQGSPFFHSKKPVKWL